MAVHTQILLQMVSEFYSSLGLRFWFSPWDKYLTKSVDQKFGLEFWQK